MLRRKKGRSKTNPRGTQSLPAGLRRVEQKQWWLSFSGVLVTLLLTAGIISLSLTIYILQRPLWDALNIHLAMRGLVGMVFLYSVYVVYQQVQIYRFRMRVMAQEELFGLIGENAADMIAVVTVRGERLYNSPSYQKLLGYTSEELEKTSAYAQIHPDDQPAVKLAAEEAKTSGIGRRVEYRIRHKSGEWRVMESTASAVRNSEGAVEKLIIVNRDITERKHLEQQLLLSQRLEAVGKLSGGVAHDFNNILGVIIGYSEALQQMMPADDPMREAVDEIEKAGRRAAALTQQLLAFSRKQVLEPKVLDLNSIVADVEKMLRRLIGEDLELEIVPASALGRVKADRGQIEQVILNLTVNARDAMPHGGKLKIETMNADLDENDARRLRYVIPGHYVMLQVSDTGTGMSAEVQSHIFEPFFTTKEQGKGTGLGLATVYGVVKQSGGYIWVYSEIDQGTTFKIYLPKISAKVEELAAVKTIPTPASGSETILFVEDEQSVRELVREYLSARGYSVLEASDGIQALDIAAAHPGAIQLLITDVVMPRLSGREIASQIATARRDLKVLYISGYTDDSIFRHGVLEGGMEFLQKPFNLRTLAQKIREILDGETAAPALRGHYKSYRDSI